MGATQLHMAAMDKVKNSEMVAKLRCIFLLRIAQNLRLGDRVLLQFGRRCDYAGVCH